MKKGSIVSEPHWTAIVYIAAVVIIVIMLIALLFFQFAGNRPMSYSIEFLNIANRPYIVSYILSNFSTTGRDSFLMTALKSSITGKYKLEDYLSLKEFMKNYTRENVLSYYDINVSSSRLDLSSNPQKCGNELDGVCVEIIKSSIFGLSYRPAGTCNVGRLEIPAGSNACPNDFACCKEASKQDYEKTSELKVVSCGSYDLGVCSADDYYMPYGSENPVKISIGCGEGRAQIDQKTSECQQINKGQTPICCAPLSPEVLDYLGYTSFANTPLFFKKNVEHLVVTIGK